MVGLINQESTLLRNAGVLVLTPDVDFGATTLCVSLSKQNFLLSEVRQSDNLVTALTRTRIIQWVSLRHPSDGPGKCVRLKVVLKDHPSQCKIISPDPSPTKIFFF